MTRSARVWAEFPGAEGALSAARELHARGYTELDAFSPYPLPEFDHIIGAKRPWAIPTAVAIAACIGGGLAFLVIWWTAAVSYPLDVGGRPLNSFVADIPILFESSVLAASVVGFGLTLVLCGLPRLNYALESLPGFVRTTTDRFWIGVVATPPEELRALSVLLESLGALRVHSLGVADD
jgi:hypothetical protein